MAKEMLINVAEGQECRIALLEDGVLQELYVERTSNESQVGNIYKGRVTNVEPSIQAAFVDFGAIKNGFLHISDLQPKYFPTGQRSTEQVGKKRARRDRPPIQECLRRGQEVIVQVTKEGIGTKGPTLTTYLSVPGRFLVMMPGMSRLGVSRKIEDEQLRHKLRELLEELKPPPDMGFIVRTAGIDRTKKDLQGDLNYLLRLWRSVQKRTKSAKAPAELFQESDLVIRTIRDVYSSEISQILCDNPDVTRKVVDFLSVVMPRSKHSVLYYHGSTPLFHRYGLENEIEKIYARRVDLPGGGSLVVDQTEALVAIDVNSGRFREGANAEDTAVKTNVRAAKEIARQLRLRDMGGVIVIDFIDMREEKHRRQVERTLRESLKNDRARMKLLRISRLGMVEMTRQRVRPSLQHSVYRECPDCKGSGRIKSDESLALSVMRSLQLACADETITEIDLRLAPGVAEYLNNHRRHHIARLESETGKRIKIGGSDEVRGDDAIFTCTDARGSTIAWDASSAAAGGAVGAESVTDVSAKMAEEALGEEELIDVAQIPPAEELGEAEGQAEQPQPVQAPRYGEPAPEPAIQTAQAGEAQGAESAPKKKRRRRGGRRHRRKKASALHTPGDELAAEPEPAQGQPSGAGKETGSAKAAEPGGAGKAAPSAPARQLASATKPDAPAKTSSAQPAKAPPVGKESDQVEADTAKAAPKRKKRRSRRGKSSKTPAASKEMKKDPTTDEGPSQAPSAAQEVDPPPTKPTADAKASSNSAKAAPAAKEPAQDPAPPKAAKAKRPRRRRSKKAAAKAASPGSAEAPGEPAPASAKADEPPSS